MKIGVLILAHSNPEQLQRLVDELKTDFTIFIHLDKKSLIPSNFFDHEPNVFVMKKYKVYWGHYNMIAATLDLFKLAYENNCDYYMLISGSDFPIKSNREIISEIDNNKNINYVSYEQLPRPDWKLDGGFDRIRLYWENLKNPQSPSFLNRFCGLCRVLQRCLRLKRKLYPLKFYGGAQWVNVSKETLKYILDFIDKYPEYLDSFRYTRIPDEIWLQTIIINSPYLVNTVNNDKRYIDWISGPDYPRVLNNCDYDKMMASNAFFARKFDMKSDMEVIKRIVRTRIND